MGTHVGVVWGHMWEWYGDTCGSGMGTHVGVVWGHMWEWYGDTCGSGMGTQCRGNTVKGLIVV